MSSKVKYAVVGLLSLLMLVCMTGMAGGNDVTTVLRTGDKKAGSENTTVKYSNKESQAPSAMLVGIDIQEMLEAQVDMLLSGSGDEPAEEPESAEEPEEIIPSAFPAAIALLI